ncbi:glycoside hydrolase family 18 protein [Lepidopterella palustris CBS 459.81]|uniref:Glycoside hydrolase family 18 protein n=1 Tax=Lepidopterella palustris CBS 459.81 TaxID=1314670 RepID=A0A8E2JIZ5_9PEZI|nr:glycoside hydrolase family 18 protein [Lepidopterella palustris CBS 459.81]
MVLQWVPKAAIEAEAEAEAEAETALSTVSRKRNTRIVVYHQTQYHNSTYISLTPLLTQKTGVTHVILAAFHLNQPAGNITLNDDPWDSSKYAPLWSEVRTLQSSSVRVMAMLGGAATGSFSSLDGSLAAFNAYYMPLSHMIRTLNLDGLDLDVEEAMSIGGIIRLVDRLHADFGDEFLITLAPVATALQGQQNLSGFDHEMLEKGLGHKIAWYNTQFYCGWGDLNSTRDYERIIARGWPAEKVVLGLVTNPANGDGWVDDKVVKRTLTMLVDKFPDFGGVMGWEYFNSVTEESPVVGKPWCWAQLMSEILKT